MTHSKPLLYFLVPASCSLVCMGAKASENLSSHSVCVCVLVIVVIPSVCTLSVCTRRGFWAVNKDNIFMISVNSAIPLCSAFSRLPNTERRHYFKTYVTWAQPTTLTLFWTTFFAIIETLTFCFRNTVGLFLSTIICTDVSLCLKWTFPVFSVLKN